MQKKNKLKKPARIALRVLYIFVAAVAAVVGGFFLGAHYQNTKHEIEQLAAQKAYYQDIMHSENAYLATLQLPEGPIAQREIDEDGAVMNPYFACFTVLALLEEPELYAENARRYLLWHMANLNTGDEDVFGVHGSINDHKIYPGDAAVSIIKKDSYDSVDSYAALFLMALAKYHEKTHDTPFIVEREAQIQSVMHAMETMRCSDGLYMNDLEHRAKYLMDNVETNAGLRGYISLLENGYMPYYEGRDDDKYAQFAQQLEYYQNALAMNTNAVSTALFDEQAGRYYVGMSSNGEKIPVAGFETFYPDTVAQIYPAAFGFDGLDKKTAGALYDAFCKHYEWEAFDERIKEQTAYYWTMTSYVGAINQDETRVQAFMAHYTDHLQADHAFPLYNADIAWVSLSCARMIERYDEQIDELNFLGLFNEY